MNHLEAVAAEFETPNPEPLPCGRCSFQLAEYMLDDGCPICRPCAAERACMRGETEYRLRKLGTVELPEQRLIEVEIYVDDLGSADQPAEQCTGGAF
jgi:hypothetical protein